MSLSSLRASTQSFRFARLPIAVTLVLTLANCAVAANAEVPDRRSKPVRQSWAEVPQHTVGIADSTNSGPRVSPTGSSVDSDCPGPLCYRPEDSGISEPDETVFLYSILRRWTVIRPHLGRWWTHVRRDGAGRAR